MKRDVIFALIFLAIGFAIGFWAGAKNALAPLVTVENVQDEEQHSSQDSFSFYEEENNPLNVKAKTNKTDTKTNDNSAHTEKKSSSPDKAEEISKTENTSIEPKKSTPEQNIPTIGAKKSITETKETKTRAFDPNALTVASFIQDWLDREATISLKNNTDRTISHFKATIIYKDKKGEILDYQEISKQVEIAPHMARKIKINAYGRDNDYAYYLSEKYIPNKNRVFKIEFKLNSYK